MNVGQLAEKREPAEPLRVLLDARKLNHGGIGVYTRNLLAGLAEREDIALTALVHPDRAAELARQPWRSRIRLIEEAAQPYSPDEMLRLFRRLPQRAFDIYHQPHYTLPYGIAIPAVITVHDLIHIHRPQRFYYPLLSRLLLRSSLSRAARVLAVSRATADDLADFCRRRPATADKVRMVPNAIDPFFLRRCAAAPSPRSGESYLLSIFSMSKPHKGLPDLLQAFAEVRAHALELGRGELRLVVAGQGADSAQGRSLADQLGLAQHVLWLGRVADAELVSLYAGAEGLVVSSLSEGFCLPVIEAQAQGTPVVARPVPAIREILTDNDVCCRDFSRAALVAGMRALLEGKRARAPRTVNQAHLAAFERGRVVAQVVQVYREAVHAGGGVCG